VTGPILAPFTAHLRWTPSWTTLGTSWGQVVDRQGRTVEDARPTVDERYAHHSRTLGTNGGRPVDAPVERWKHTGVIRSAGDGPGGRPHRGHRPGTCADLRGWASVHRLHRAYEGDENDLEEDGLPPEVWMDPHGRADAGRTGCQGRTEEERT
jgi:hypothetical protein